MPRVTSFTARLVLAGVALDLRAGLDGVEVAAFVDAKTLPRLQLIP